MPRRRENKPQSVFSKEKILNVFKQLLSFAKDPRKLFWPATFFICLEIIINIIVIERVPYTEIDWKAYMQEVEGFLNGTTNYSQLKGDTGPLVYPAGFVYIFSGLYFLTSQGVNIKVAQYIFAVLHIILLILIFRIYERTKKVPPYILLLVFSTSYRIHSIFVLRLFNDPIAMILLFASINAYIDQKWYLGSILYSLAVSVKMNILLFSPAILAAFIANLGYMQTLVQLILCASIQLILGFPFLIENPTAYVRGAFNIGRIFEHKWTVNWRFLPPHLFVNPIFHISLIVLNIVVVIYFFPKWMKYFDGFKKLNLVKKDLNSQFDKKTSVDMSTIAQLFILPLFTANFIGITFSRSLHYQFYIWYYHTLPYLVWCCNFKIVNRLVILGIIELCWNTYPSTVYSSIGLHCCHFVMLYGLIRSVNKSVKSS